MTALAVTAAFSAGNALWHCGHSSGAPQISANPHEGHLRANSRSQLGQIALYEILVREGADAARRTVKLPEPRIGPLDLAISYTVDISSSGGEAAGSWSRCGPARSRARKPLPGGCH